jgi:hypothetical protein
VVPCIEAAGASPSGAGGSSCGAFEGKRTEGRNRKKGEHLMTLGRGLAIPFVLVALAILLPDAAEAGCCDCDYNGTHCSACCYDDQWADCNVYGSGSSAHCGCYCSGGGGGGGGGCGGMMLSSRTLVIGSDGGSELAGHQLRFGLLRPGGRREGSFIFEEWALVSSAGDKATVLNASTVEFGKRVQAVAERFRPRGTSAVLVIEDAEHPHNSREILVPEVAPIDIDAGLPVDAAGQEAWFRAEVNEDGVVDQVILFSLPEALASGSIHERLREHLSLRYADEGRHRVVVFGAVRADATGRLVMTTSRVVLPTCCCYGHRCV